MHATVAGLGLALGACVAGGGAPLAALALARATGDAASPAFLLIGTAAVAAAACFVVRREGSF
jgi:LPXTG-motif cell wall-anchored protein